VLAVCASAIGYVAGIFTETLSQYVNELFFAPRVEVVIAREPAGERVESLCLEVGYEAASVNSIVATYGNDGRRPDLKGLFTFWCEGNSIVPPVQTTPFPRTVDKPSEGRFNDDKTVFEYPVDRLRVGNTMKHRFVLDKQGNLSGCDGTYSSGDEIEKSNKDGLMTLLPKLVGVREAKAEISFGGDDARVFFGGYDPMAMGLEFLELLARKRFLTSDELADARLRAKSCPSCNLLSLSAIVHMARVVCDVVVEQEVISKAQRDAAIASSKKSGGTKIGDVNPIALYVRLLETLIKDGRIDKSEGQAVLDRSRKQSSQPHNAG
jgi:hypothetical protein